MKITEIVKGCFHVESDGKTALLGAPPEIIKHIQNAGKVVPPVGVLPDVSYVNGVSQIALEFPGYWFLFGDRSADRPEKFRIIGTEDMCRRVKEILEITLLGPSRKQLKGWKVSKSRSDFLLKLSSYMALKKDGVPQAIEDLFEFVSFPDAGSGPVRLFSQGDPTTIRRLGANIFEIAQGKKSHKIDLNFDGDQLPMWFDPSDELEVPQVLRLKLLGSYSGFDATGPTTGMVLWVNCNGFLIDGPVGTSEYLRSLGIPKADLRGVILSHVHDDHCTLMDMILSEQTTNIITTREIYESMLIKVANALGEPIDQVRNYLTFTEVIPGKSVSMYGAQWEFFYTVHSIPTIGFRVSVRGPDGKDHTIVHSSDGMDFEGMARMRAAGALGDAHEERIKNLVRGNERLVMLDGGGPPIHGNPSDYARSMKENPDTDFLVGHVSPDKVKDRRCIPARPGWGKTYLEGKNLPQSLVLKLLKTLKLLEVSDPAWINILLSQGEVMELGPNVEVVSQGQLGDNFYFVLAGSQQVLDASHDPPALLATLEGGDFFGEMSIIRNVERNATVRTRSSSVLFRLPGELFLEFVEANGLKERFERIWLSRSIISEVVIFRNLHPHAKHELSLLGTEQTFRKGDTIIRQGGKSDDFFIITRGQAEVVKKNRRGDESVRTKLSRGDFFGENVAMGYRNARNASVIATSAKLETLRFGGRDLRRLAESAPVLQHELHLVMKERGMTEIPVTPRESAEFFIKSD